ncbi:cas scaffolding protein family member 4 isoform X2 [Echeneis naucrates]|nr:cas scaffolding protein family member 4 isoform X2 [Echeneis naucrates]
MCSLYGRHGLAPANRLQLLPQTGPASGFLHNVLETPILADAKPDDRMQNIYQIPSIPRPSSNLAYECMDKMHKFPSTKHSTEGPEEKPRFCNTVSSQQGEVYDVPVRARRASLFNASTTTRHMSKKHSLIPLNELEQRFDSVKYTIPGDTYVYAVPPPLPQDPNYDIPLPSGSETQQKIISGCNTLPNPRRPEWIYDVPMGPERSSSPEGVCDTMPHKACRQLYDTLPARAPPTERASPTPSVYDIPKSISFDLQSPPKVVPIYDKLPTQIPEEESPQGEPHPISAQSDHIPLEYRGDSGNVLELNRVCLQKMRNFLACTAFHNLPGSGESFVHENSERGRILHHTQADNQRISRASSSSTSSCDSLALSSSSPEPLREVMLSQDKACHRLLELQESICRAVPLLMEFVSSHWRSKEHLEKHLKEIKEAAEGILCSVMCFLNFSLDVKGNARRLTDANLQTRLYKQLSIIEDSGLILQQTVSALNMAGWPLNILCQNPGQVQTPDQLERFVMVARTIPEDVKRLVSIIIANSKLLFRASQKDPQPFNITSQPETLKSADGGKKGVDALEEENDYVELQTKTDFEEQQKKIQREPQENVTPVSNKILADKKHHSSESSSGTEEQQSPSLSEHCRLYFGALQKAIGGFVYSLNDGHPPEKFISQSKLVIMVGQRLVDTLCREAQHGDSSQSLLLKSNHLCALLKQLAIATKKAALEFPDKQALREAQEFAKELAQRAQNFRLSLDF